MQRRPRPLIHLWCPDMFDGKGGIGVFSSFLLRAVREWHDSGNCRVIIKHDRNKNGFNANGGAKTNFNFAGRWPAAIRTPAYAAKLLRWAITERPDLIIAGHLHFAPLANIIQRATGIPYWILTYGIEAWDVNEPRLKKAFRDASQILAISEYTRSRLVREQNLNSSRVSLLPCAVEKTQFVMARKPNELLSRYGLSPDQPVILTVSRLVRSDSYKGYASVLRAMPAIRKAIPNVHYVLVGTGDDRPRVERLVHNLGLKDCVTLAGYVSDAELCAHYNLCDVFAMPSKREGFGIVYLEAMACGKPTLGGNKDGAVDALMNGELGALVDPDDPSEIATTLIAILKKEYPLPLMYEPMNLRARVLEEYGYERFRTLVATHLDDFFSAQRARATVAKAVVS